MAWSSLPLPVPTTYGSDGLSLDISSIQGKKTILLDGSYDGQYLVYGSHDNVNFVPIFSFSGGRPQSIKQSFDSSYLSIQLHSLATNVVGVTASVSGNSTGNSSNSFAALPVIPINGYGPQPIIDLYSLVPPTGFFTGTNIILSGNFIGTISVEGSFDGTRFSPIGAFRNLSPPTQSNGLQPSIPKNEPLAFTQPVRYLRANVLDGTFVISPLFATVGGETSTTGGAGSQGWQGAQGQQGWQGYQGWQGWQGWQGDRGPQGLRGYVGFQGRQGFQGTNPGPQGDMGFQGFQGWFGTQGWQGTPGESAELSFDVVTVADVKAIFGLLTPLGPMDSAKEWLVIEIKGKKRYIPCFSR